MWIIIPCALLLSTAISLIFLRQTRPSFRFTWLIAVGGSLSAWLAVLLWPVDFPITLSLPAWQPARLFGDSPLFIGDRLAWPFAISITTLAVAIMLTAGAREDFPNARMWAGAATITAIGLLAVTAANPLSLVLVWTTLDLVELITLLWSVNGPGPNERVVIAFSSRILGSALLVWANMVSASTGNRLEFSSVTSQAGLYLVAASGLRLGVLPLHLPYPVESSLRRGFGTCLRMVSAASSLVLLARVPSSSVSSTFAPILLILAAAAAIYAGWEWLRSPDPLSGRPYWMIGMAALAVSAALRANPLGAVAWSCALILSGSALFLFSVQQIWLNRMLLLGAWGLSALPFSLTAGAWLSNAWFQITLPILVVAQSFLMAGFIRHALHPGNRREYETQPVWIRNLYPAGIGLVLGIQTLLGIWGWSGARQSGEIVPALAAVILTLLSLWALPRVRLMKTSHSDRIRTGSGWLDGMYRNVWALYRYLGRMSQVINGVLEGDGGVMWTLLFLVLFVTVITQRMP